MIIQSRLAKSHDFRMFSKPHEIIGSDVEFLMRIVGMRTDRAIDVIVGFRDGENGVELTHPRGNRHHTLDTSVERPLHDVIALRFEFGKIQMAVGIDKHGQTQFCSSVST